MKCEVCSELLEEYLDGELEPQAHAQVGEHLIECAECSASFAALTAEQQLFARYDRELEVPPFLWTRVAAHTVAENNSPKVKGWAAIFARPLASVIAVLLFAIAVGIVYLASRKPEPNKAVADINKPAPTQPKDEEPEKPELVAAQPKLGPRVRRATNHVAPDQSDVLSSDLAYLSSMSKTPRGTSNKQRTCCGRSETSPLPTATRRSTSLTTSNSLVAC